MEVNLKDIMEGKATRLTERGRSPMSEVVVQEQPALVRPGRRFPAFPGPDTEVEKASTLSSVIRRAERNRALTCAAPCSSSR